MSQQAKSYLHTMQAHGRVLRGNPPRSISDDDLCATCANRVDQPDSDLSRCRAGWPTIINPDGYITECAQHQKPAPGPTPGYRCTHGLGYKCTTCYAQPGEVPYL